MIKIGPHVSKALNANTQRTEAKTAGWGTIQTFAGSPRTLNLGLDIPHYIPNGEDPITWVVHSAYPAFFNPPERTKAINAAYLDKLAVWCKMVGAKYAVIHFGGSKGRDPETEVANTIEYINKNVRKDYLIEHDIKFLVENIAAAYPLNQDLKWIQQVASCDRRVFGWCLDYAHSNAAGVPYSQVMKYLRDENLRPDVIHNNYPGSEFGSGRDRHGWFYKDEAPVTQEEKMMWRECTKEAYKQGIPLILEGGSIPGDYKLEFKAVSELVLEETNDFGKS